MNHEFISNLTETGKVSYQSLQELNDIYAHVFNKVADLHLTLAKLGLECSYEQARLLTDMSSYEGLLSAETDFANAYGSKLMAVTRKSGEVMLESHDEFSTWVGKQLFNGNKPQLAKEKPVKPKPAAKRATAKKEAA